MKKYIALFVIGSVILCGIEAVALPLNHTGSVENLNELNTTTTNLTVTIIGGPGSGSYIIKNVGECNATNVHWYNNVTYKGLYKTIIHNSSGSRNILIPLAPGESINNYWHLLFLGFPIGFGPFHIKVTAYADNALPVTATAKGIILVHFVILIK